MADKKMHSLAELAKAINRPTIYISGLQSRFDLPAFRGAAYPDCYLAFLQTIVYLRTLSISEDTLRDLWRIEKKLLSLLHVDSTGSPTWSLDCCGATADPNRRLLLSNYDTGAEVLGKDLQLGLNFADTTPELFAGQDMGEDAMRVLDDYRKLFTRIRKDANAELPRILATAAWATQRW